MGIRRFLLHRFDEAGKALFMALPSGMRAALAPLAYRIHARIRRLTTPGWTGAATQNPGIAALVEDAAQPAPIPRVPIAIKRAPRKSVKERRVVFVEPPFPRWLARGGAGAGSETHALTWAVDCTDTAWDDVATFIDAVKAQTATAFHLSLALPQSMLDAARARLEGAAFAWSVLLANSSESAAQRYNAQIGATEAGHFVFWPDARFVPGPLFVEAALFQLARTGDDVFFFHIDHQNLARVPFQTPSAVNVARLGPLSPIVAVTLGAAMRLRDIEQDAPLLARAAPDAFGAAPSDRNFFNPHSLAFAWCRSDYLLSLWDLFVRLGPDTRYRTLFGRALIRMRETTESETFGAAYARRHAALHYLVQHEDPAEAEGATQETLAARGLAQTALASLQVGQNKEPGILCCLPFRVNGNLTLRILDEIDRRGTHCYIASQANATGQYIEDSGPWTERYDRSFRLSEMDVTEAEWIDVLRHIIRTRQIGSVLLAGAFEVYPMLPILTAEFPSVRFIDQLFNPVGHTRRHLAFKDYFDEVIVENEEMVRFLSERGVSKERITKIRSGVDLQKFSREAAQEVMLPPEDLPFDPEVKFIFGYVGRMSWEKDPLGFIEIVKETLARAPNAGALIAGGGPQASTVAQRALELLPQGRFVNLGFVDDVRSALAACDVIVVPSRVDGLPGVIQEANALGVPVVATSVGGIPEMIVDGVSGRLYPIGRHGQAADILAELAANPSALATMKKNARRHVAKTFSAERMYQTYQTVLTKRKRGQRGPSGSGDAEKDAPAADPSAVQKQP